MKKIISMLLIFSFLICAAAIVNAEDMPTYNQNQLGLLNALGILGSETDYSATITRGEFVNYIAALLNIKDKISNTGGTTLFQDVDTSHPISGILEYLYAKGIVDGDGKGNFEPDSAIIVSQAIKMLVSAIGYKNEAEMNGGFPIGYNIAANRIGLLRNLSFNPSDDLSASTLITLLFNALETEVLEPVSINAENVLYSKGNKLIEEAFDVYKINGIVKENEHTSLAQNIGLSKKSVKIGEEIYKTDTTRAKDYLGYNVEAYVKENQSLDISQIIYIKEDTINNETIKISSGEISNIADNRIKYLKDDKKYEVKYTPVPFIIYNGKAINKTLNELIPKSGYIEAIDNNKDGYFDVIKITSYITYVVDSVNVARGKIIDKLSRPILSIDIENSNVVYGIIKDGKEIGFKDIKEWNVVMVAADVHKKMGEFDVVDDENATLYEIVVVDKSYGGIIQELNETEGIIKVDSDEFEMSVSLIEAINNAAIIKPKIGSAATFYMDIDGKIAGLDTSEEAGKKYGFLLEFGDKVGLSNLFEIKMLDQDSKVKLYYMSEDVIIDGAKEKSNIQNRLLNTDGTIKNMLIVYELNESGQIKSIDTAYLNEGVEDKEDSLRLDVDIPIGEKKYYSSFGNNFDRTFRSDAAAKVFVVSPRIKENKISEVDYKYLSVSTPAVFGADGSYNYQAFNIGRDKMTNIIVYYNDQILSGSDIRWSSNLAIITKVSNGINSDDAATTKLALRKSASKEDEVYLLADNDILELKDDNGNVTGTLQLNIGDIVIYELDTLKNIKNIKKVFDIKEFETQYGELLLNGKKPEMFKTITSTKDHEQYIGQIYTKGTTGFGIAIDVKVDKPNMAIEDTRVIGKTSNIVIFKNKTKKVTNGVWEDIYDYLSVKSLKDTSIVYIKSDITFAKDIFIIDMN